MYSIVYWRMSMSMCIKMIIKWCWWWTDSARAQHPLHGDVSEGEHQHWPRLLGAGRGHPRQDGGPGRRCRSGAHRRRAPPLPRPARARLLHLGVGLSRPLALPAANYTPPPNQTAGSTLGYFTRTLPTCNRTPSILIRILNSLQYIIVFNFSMIQDMTLTRDCKSKIDHTKTCVVWM